MIVLLVIASLVVRYLPLTTQLCHIPNGISLAEQTYYFPIFDFHLFFRFYRAYLASEFSTFLYIPLPS